MSKNVDYQETWNLIMTASRIAIVSHIGPDGDTTGSGLALAEALRQKGKTVHLLVDDVIPPTYRFMPGADGYHQVAEGETIPTDLTVVVDASSKDRMGANEAALSSPILNIDHHISNTHYADYLLLDPKAAATGEIIYRLFKENHVPINKNMAICLYTAIVTDCGFFKYGNTTPACMMAAAELLPYGVHPDEISDILEMKSRETIELLAKVLPTLTFYEGGKISTLEIHHGLYRKEISTDSFIYYPRYIEGVEVAVVFKAVEEDETRVSMRSRSVDVSQIALSFGGGGHVKAAGCTIKAPLPEAKESLIKALSKALQGA